MPKPLPTADPQELARIREHYELEVALAARLRESAPGDRQELYTAVYDELFRTIPWHVQHARDETYMAAANARLRAFLRPWLTPEAAVLEIGAGDGTFSRDLAGRVGHAYALDVSSGARKTGGEPANYDFLLSDGVSIPLPDATVDLAFSNQLIEHVHPDDVQPHLREVLRVLRPGGRYVLLTPTRLSGPHDVSGFFHDEPRGFHLKEYSCGDLARELRTAGYRDVRQVMKLKQWLGTPPATLPATLERLVELLPRDVQRRVCRRAPLAHLVSVRLVARR
jgi:SAM-dependent methyltransferase